MSDIKEKLKTFVSVSATIVREIDVLEDIVKKLLKQKDAVEHELEQFKVEKLKVAKDVQSKVSAFKKYEDEIRGAIETEKSKLGVLIKDQKGKVQELADKIKDVDVKKMVLDKAKVEADALKSKFDIKLKKFNDEIKG